MRWVNVNGDEIRKFTYTSLFFLSLDTYWCWSWVESAVKWLAVTPQREQWCCCSCVISWNTDVARKMYNKYKIYWCSVCRLVVYSITVSLISYIFATSCGGEACGQRKTLMELPPSLSLSHFSEQWTLAFIYVIRMTWIYCHCPSIQHRFWVQCKHPNDATAAVFV